MTSELHDRLIAACLRFMTPIARFLLRAGIGYREFSEVCKVAFVQVASSEYGIRGRQTNVSRVAVMTGITRKEVRRIRDGIHQGSKPKIVKWGPAATVLNAWYTDLEFVDEQGRPRLLPFQGDGSFSILVRKHGGDIPPGALRTELLRAQAIEELSDGTFRVLKRDFVPVDFDEKLIVAISMTLPALATTIAHNTDPNRKETGRIERFVFSRSIGRKAIRDFRKTSRDRIEAFVDSMADLVAANEGDQRGTPDSPIAGVGVFYYEQD